ncbi:MAG TPA: cytochrome c biogenesis protein CcsA [Gemmatimonadaceae bacterium]|nr:cytochrome c biogenesis protein CcsA [Gemmatimonadaceae bacterium]
MIAIAHFVATTCYLGAAALAAAPFARPVRAPFRVVLGVLALGVLAHGVALVGVGRTSGQVPLTGLGPALSFAGAALALTLLIVELIARETSLTLVAAPLAALLAVVGNLAGLAPSAEPPGGQGPWFFAHIALSFAGLAGLATAAAAGTMYLLQRRELRSRRFGPLFRFFPPLATLDRINRVAVLAGWVGLTLGILIGLAYSLTFHQSNMPQVVWALGAWAGITALALGRVARGWEARRAAVAANAAFAVVVLLWIAVRIVASEPGKFL